MIRGLFFHAFLVSSALTLAQQNVSSSAATEPANSTLSSLKIPKLPSLVGVTLSGMDFAANATTESANLTDDPFTLPSFEQTMHYLEERNASVIKLPVAWESLQNSTSVKKLNRTILDMYTDVVATVTARDAAVIVTLAISPERFANLTSHMGKPNNSSASFADPTLANATSIAFIKLWGKLAKHFRHDRRVIFHLMAMPYNTSLPRKWNETIQDAVTAIRKQNASNVIILPSYAPPINTTYSSFRDFPRYFENMKHIKNPDGTTDGIVFDLSQTLGPKRPVSPRCGGVNATAIVQPVVKLLRKNDRQAIVGTLAAGSEDSCARSLARFAKDISQSYPYLAGFVLYGAGAYNETSPWALVKEGKFDETHCSEDWVDQPNFNSVRAYFKNATSASSSP